MNDTPTTRFLPDEEATQQLGGRLAQSAAPPLTVYLQGDLGAGKTTFVRGLLRGAGFQGTVKSPTYSIVESYPLPRFAVHHFDLYRFGSPEEWEDAGLDDFFAANSLCLIEWPQQGGTFVPDADLTITLEHSGAGRNCTITAHTEQGRKSLQAWLN